MDDPRHAPDLTPDPQRSPQRRLTEAQKRSIIAAVAQGETKQSVARRFHCHPNTIGNLCKHVDGLPANGISGLAHELGDWKAGHKRDAISAVTNGLRCADEPYKQGTLGKEVLRGLGEYVGDNQVNVTVQAMIANIPPDWRDEMVLTPPLIKDDQGKSASLVAQDVVDEAK